MHYIKKENKKDSLAFHKISYGLYLLLTHDGIKDNACVINTVQLVTDTPHKISIAVNKENYTHDIIMKTKKFNVSVLTQSIKFDVFERFGFHSGRDINKFEDTTNFERSENNLLYMKENANAFISATVEKFVDCGTHTLFVATVDNAQVLSENPSVTYEYYFAHIKPKQNVNTGKKAGWVCKICGYFYENENIPDDFICPLCKHGVKDFEYVK